MTFVIGFCKDECEGLQASPLYCSAAQQNMGAITESEIDIWSAHSAPTLSWLPLATWAQLHECAYPDADYSVPSPEGHAHMDICMRICIKLVSTLLKIVHLHMVSLRLLDMM